MCVMMLNREDKTRPRSEVVVRVTCVTCHRARDRHIPQPLGDIFGEMATPSLVLQIVYCCKSYTMLVLRNRLLS